MATTQATKEDSTRKLYLHLRRHHGAINEIADRAGVSRQMVLYVLTGKRTSFKVLEKAASVLVEREQRAAELRTLVRDTLDTVESLRPIHPQVKAIAG